MRLCPSVCKDGTTPGFACPATLLSLAAKCPLDWWWGCSAPPALSCPSLPQHHIMPGAHTPRPAPLPEGLLATPCSPSTRKKNKNKNHQLAFPPGAEQAMCLPTLSMQVLSWCARLQLAGWAMHTKARNRHKSSVQPPVFCAQLTGRSTSNLGDSRILQERHAAGNAFPKAGIPQLTLCSLASPLSLQAACSSQLVHLVLFHLHCPQFTHFSCLLCPLIPDRLKSKTRQRFIK